MRTRRGEFSDLDAYVAIQQEEWGEAMAASREQLASRLEHFPESMVVAESDRGVVAAASFIRLAGYDIDRGLSWEDLTDSGWATNHVAGGPILFGIDLSVSRYAPRSTSARLFIASLEYTMHQGVDALYWGSRLPRYHKHAETMSASAYLQARTSRGRYLDPELQIYSRVPGLEILGAVPDYFKDWESCNYGAILRWRNPIRHYPFLRPFSGRLLQHLYKRERKRRI